MDKYLETGVHPDMEEARAMSTERNVYALPERDPNRQHVFIEISCREKLLGCPPLRPVPSLRQPWVGAASQET